MWKYLAESVRGTSHISGDLDCQDVCRAQVIGDYLVLVAADGAGSASHAALGAATACESILRSAENQLGGGATGVSEIMIRAWVSVAHSDVEQAAVDNNVAPRELACTLLLAVLGPNHSAFAQIGDGVIVAGENDSLSHVFWPSSGEYQNTTFFLSESTYAENLRVEIRPPVQDAALLTDGLQMLALKYAEQAVHAPFFLPMFKALRAADDFGALAGPLRTFLDSPAVNERTDDDKTLILATRVGNGKGV